jgi:hypothetical protein
VSAELDSTGDVTVGSSGAVTLATPLDRPPALVSEPAAGVAAWLAAAEGAAPFDGAAGAGEPLPDVDGGVVETSVEAADEALPALETNGPACVAAAPEDEAVGEDEAVDEALPDDEADVESLLGDCDDASLPGVVVDDTSGPAVVESEFEVVDESVLEALDESVFDAADESVFDAADESVFDAVDEPVFDADVDVESLLAGVDAVPVPEFVDDAGDAVLSVDPAVDESVLDDGDEPLSEVDVESLLAGVETVPVPESEVDDESVFDDEDVPLSDVDVESLLDAGVDDVVLPLLVVVVVVLLLSVVVVVVVLLLFVVVVVSVDDVVTPLPDVLPLLDAVTLSLGDVVLLLSAAPAVPVDDAVAPLPAAVVVESAFAALDAAEVDDDPELGSDGGVDEPPPDGAALDVPVAAGGDDGSETDGADADCISGVVAAGCVKTGAWAIALTRLATTAELAEVLVAPALGDCGAAIE